MSKGTELLKKLRERKEVPLMNERMSEAEMRDKYPAIQEAWEKYQLVLKLYK